MSNKKRILWSLILVGLPVFISPAFVACDNSIICTDVGCVNTVGIVYEEPVDFYHTVQIVNYATEADDFTLTCNSDNDYCNDDWGNDFFVNKFASTAEVLIKDEEGNLLLSVNTDLKWSKPYYPNGKECDKQGCRSTSIVLPAFDETLSEL